VQAVVTRPDGVRDHLALRVQLAEGADEAAIAEGLKGAVQGVCRVKVDEVGFGSLAADASPVVDVQKQTRETIDYARVERDAVIVETYGRPMAVILSYDEYLAYMSYKAKQEQRSTRFALLRDAAAQNAAYNQLSEEQAIKLVEEARQEIAEEG
jgi:PHD/YefM family antitoxin component YafN of YafNO toxin-antitoxin module